MCNSVSSLDTNFFQSVGQTVSSHTIERQRPPHLFPPTRGPTKSKSPSVTGVANATEPIDDNHSPSDDVPEVPALHDENEIEPGETVIPSGALGT